MVKKIKTTDIISTMASDKDCLIIDEDMLTKHTLFVGATGSGKTTTMNVLLRDLIRYKSDCTAQKIGLLIFDFKDDGTLYKIKKWAKECGRSKDVVNYSAGSGIYFNPFSEFSAFEHTGSISDMLTSLNPPEGDDNRYWDMALRKRIKFVLHSMILFEVPITFESFAEWFLRLITSNLSDWKKGLAKSLKALIALSKQAGEPLKSEYEKILKIAVSLKAQMEEWEKLDPRTKSNEVSTMTNFSEAFNSPNAIEFLRVSKAKKPLDLSEILNKGKIVVATLPGATDRCLASTIGKMLKATFYRLVQNRRVSFEDNSRLLGVIMDEFPLCATCGDDIASDTFNMQTIRSKKAFVVAATQGLVSLDCIMGEDQRLLLMTNFNNYFFFRSNEYEVQNLCNNMTFTSATNERNIGFLAEPESATPPQNIEVENLDTGYAYVKLANGYRSNVPLKMERLYVKLLPEPKDKPEQPDYQKICISAIKPYLKELELTKLMKDYDV